MYEIFKNFPVWLQYCIVLFPAVSITVAGLAFVLNFRQARLTNSLARARMVSENLHTFMDDDVIQNAFYKIEYGEFQYDSNFHGSEQEKEIDKLLRHFSNIALMWKNNFLSLKDLHPIQYFILRTVDNPEVQKYLHFIDSWSKNAGTGGHPYVALNELSTALKRRKEC